MSQAQDADDSAAPCAAAAAAAAPAAAAATSRPSRVSRVLAGGAPSAWDRMSSADQLLSLPDADVLPMLQDNWRTHNARVASHGAEEIDTWTVPQLEAICSKLHIMMRGKADMIADIKKVIVGPKAAPKQTTQAAAASARRAPAGGNGGQDDGSEEEEQERRQPPARAARSRSRSPRAPAPHGRLDAALHAAMARPLLTGSPLRRDGQPSRGARASGQQQLASPPRARTSRPSSRYALEEVLQDLGAEEEAVGASDEDDGMPLDANAFLRDVSRGESRSFRDRPRAEVDDEMDAAGLDRPFARAFLANVLRGSGGKSVAQVFRYDVDFAKDERSKNECWALARIADALLARDWEQALELTCRRLAGVHTASTSGNWAVCDALEMNHGRQSFVPGRVLQQALKSVVRIEALHRSTKPDSLPRGSGSARYQNKTSGGYREESADFRSASDSKKGAGDQARRISAGGQARGSGNK